MTTTYNLSISKNPQFQTVLSLANTTFDRTNVRSGYMATEDQIQQLWQDIVRLEERIDYCCRDIVYWDFQIRIRDKYGNIMSDYLQNRTTGTMRRGKNFTMKLPIKAVPKYEAHLAGVNYGPAYEDGSALNCPLPSAAAINDLCGLLYRGTSGTYFDMSARQSDSALGFSRANDGANGIEAFMIDVNGNMGNANALTNANALFRIPNDTHFAYVDSNNDIYVNVSYPIGDMDYFTPSGDQRKPYGRVYRFDIRDVTLGG